MKHIKKFNESLKVSYSNEDIEEIFYDLTDNGAALLEIIDSYITKDNEVIKVTPYIKNPTKTRYCKLVKLILKNENNKDEIDLSIVGMGIRTMSIELLEDITSRIKRFYTMLNNQEEKFIIKPDYMGINIYFVVIGDYLSEDINKSELIDKYLNELQGALKIDKNYQIRINGNWLEMKGNDAEYKSQQLYKIKSGQWNVEHEIYEIKNIKVLIDWYNKLRSDNLDIHISGGDKQLVIKIAST